MDFGRFFLLNNSNNGQENEVPFSEEELRLFRCSVISTIRVERTFTTIHQTSKRQAFEKKNIKFSQKSSESFLSVFITCFYSPAAALLIALLTMTSTAAPILQEVPRRYVEQLQTTVETMRRRGVAMYDGMFRLADRSSSLLEKAREVIEPTAYDVKDFVIAAVNNVQPLDEKNRELRNNLLEMYLGKLYIYILRLH